MSICHRGLIASIQITVITCAMMTAGQAALAREVVLQDS